MKNRQAFSLFLKRERKQLFGNKCANLFVLWGISLIAVLSISFASASLSFLEEKMKDPFVSCVNIIVGQQTGRGYEELRDSLTVYNEQDRFGFSYPPETVYFLSEKFLNSNSKPRQLDGQTFSVSSPLARIAFDPTNVIEMRTDSIEDSDFGVVITEKALDDLDLPKAAFLTQSTIISGKEYRFAVPILAIVKQLPNMCDIIYTKSYASHEIEKEADHFDVSKPEYNKGLVIGSLNDTLVDLIIALIDKTEYDVDLRPCLSTWKNEDYIEIVIKSKFTTHSDSIYPYDSIYNVLSSSFSNIYRIYDFSFESMKPVARDPEYYYCYFDKDSLQYRVENFAKELDSSLDYKLDMDKVNNLKNLAYVNQMGTTLSICVMIIAIIFICVFVYFLLNMHFKKIQRNLGTFKAFGVDNKMLLLIYLRIIVELVIASFVMAFLLVGLISMILSVFIETQWLDVFAWQNLLLLFSTLLLSFIATYKVSFDLLRHTPGDLIYNRK